jgi:hypothetical protein
MNAQPVQTSQFGSSLFRPLNQTVDGVRSVVKALLAHVRETLTREAPPSDDIVGMNAHMLRDIGAEASIRSRPVGRPDLQYPRL